MSGHKKPLDERIFQLVARSLKLGERGLYLMLGDRSVQRRQIVNLHYLLSQATRDLLNPNDEQKKNPNPDVLWCYKKDLGFSTNQKKRHEKLKRQAKRGQKGAIEDLDPFEAFLNVANIRFCYYSETENILGKTYGMLVLQDFEAITPNVLARTIETVQGGGMVVILLQGMSSLRSLYSMAMDVHDRYRTSTSAAEPVARFNERFLLSLGANENCLMLDDELNVLSLSKGKNIDCSVALSGGRSSAAIRREESESSLELKELSESLKDTDGIGQLIPLCKTLDQARALLQFADALSSKNLQQTVSLTAGRGRGKSAALGLSLALAIFHSYANIYVTSPSPENLGTVFDFVLKGFDALGWVDHLDYSIIKSTNPDWKDVIIRINVFRHHRQTIQYIAPWDAQLLSQAELVVIDEAAAIPLPKVKALLGPYLVFMSSTINGYEGTGRSLSLKLIQQLREQQSATGAPDASKSQSSTHRTLKEVKLETPIRYALGDPIERWLNHLLCLDASVDRISSVPHPDTCELYYVNRDTLFSYHPASEMFLQRLMGLYVSSHYKNSPNDLQLMSDAPGQHLFVLLPPVSDSDTSLPKPLVVLQVALEGNLNKARVRDSIAAGGKLAGGDLIPWTLAQQFQDDHFASLLGARVIRIATHPDVVHKGYGTRALELLDKFYSGALLDPDATAEKSAEEYETFESVAQSSTDAILYKKGNDIGLREIRKMAPLLQQLSFRIPEPLDYVGVSFGITPALYGFWERSGYLPLYMRQTANELTGEHTCIMLKSLQSNEDEGTPDSRNQVEWLQEFAHDFHRRFASLLSFAFRELPAPLSSEILTSTSPEPKDITISDIESLFARLDLKRLDAYSNGTLDFHAILDLMPILARLFFDRRFGDTRLSAVQRAIMVSLGLQHQPIEHLQSTLDLPAPQLLALLIKCVRKFSKVLRSVQEQALVPDLPDLPAAPEPTAKRSRYV